ncbi:uncharacterized protein LOC135437852 [Drosophila montana]|uniref:uncharacterized protein LOC135437852 n=1 Tax=Drosophila montana TaxID=40370 RepID=UPI00313D9D70
MLTFLLLLVSAGGVIYVWLNQHYTYWRRRGVPGERPVFLLGNMRGFARSVHWMDINWRIYDKFRGRERFCGFYTFLSKAFFVLDLELIKRIMISDFNSFADRGLFHNVRDDPLTGNLLFLDGEQWRWLRQHLTPVFSSGKMKFMFPTMVQVGEQLALSAEQQLGEFEAKDLCARFTTDVIGSCAFGLECNSLANPGSEFREMGRSITERPLHQGMVQAFMFAQPQLARKLRLRLFRPEVSQFFMDTVRQTMEYRKREHVKRNDLIQLLIELGERTDETEAALSFEQIAAQALVFFLAGFDTSSTTMSFCLYELALNPAVQQQLRQEIQGTLKRHKQQLSYECLQEMTYLNQVVAETLRKYPVLPHLVRRTTNAYNVPESSLVLEPGTRVMIPVHSIHHDPDIYPDPESFDPSRFEPEAILSRHQFAYLPFGNGPRACIGERFGLMQVKIGIVTLLRHYQFRSTQRTQIPLKFSKKNFLIATESGIHLQMERLDVDSPFDHIVQPLHRLSRRRSVESETREMLDVIALLLITLAVGFWFVRTRLSYWARRSISHARPTFPMGNLQGFRKDKHFKDILTPLYESFKPTGAPFAGFYFMLRPVVLVLDLDLAKEVLIRDFANFEDRGLYHNERDDPLTGHLFRIDGPKWRPLRQKMTSTFSSGKMKFMFPTVCAVGEELAQVCAEQAQNSICGILEINDLMARYTSDVIGSCVFGLDCNGLRNPEAEFAVMGRRAFIERRHNKLIDGFIESFPSLARRLRLCQIHQDITDFYMRIVRDTVKERESKGIVRNDFINLLIEMKQRGELTLPEMAAQSFIFFVAGFDTSASTLGFALYELAKQPQLQLKLRQDIEQALQAHGGQFTYECMQELRYMELVIAETLRKYPVLPHLSRVSRNFYAAKGNKHFYIEPGQMVFVPVYGIHHDPELYPEPHKFIPERFLADQMAQRHTASWLPFGDGPRNCIGMRFGKMQTSVALFYLLKRFQFSVCPRTVSKIDFVNSNILLCPANGIYLKVEELKK